MTQSSPNPREKEFGGPFETLKPRIFGKCHVLQTSPRSTHALCDDRSCHCLGSQPKSSKNPKLEAENSSFGWRHQKNFYNHLKNKATDPVLDNDGNIVYNPCHAMYTIIVLLGMRCIAPMFCMMTQPTCFKSFGLMWISRFSLSTFHR